MCRPDLLPPGARVLVAYSGGLDSTVLLHLLRRLSEERDLTLRAAHFDHGLRPGSAEEARTAADRARAAGVDCVVGRPARPLERDQAAYRRARYAFLRRCADAWSADRVATAHHADDQAETVLFRLLRGTGAAGLTGIPPRRDRLVRPLLPFRRGELEAWARARGLAWLSDPANEDPRYARSRVRHVLLPALERAWDASPGDLLLRVAAAAREAERRADGLADAALDTALRETGAAGVGPLSEGGREGETGGRVRLSRPVLLRCGEELRARVIRRLARERGVRLTSGGTRAAVAFIDEGASGGRVDIGEGLAVGREFDTVWLGPPSTPGRSRPLRIPPRSTGRGAVEADGCRFLVRWGDAEAARGAEYRVALPERLRGTRLFVRGWRDGDRIRLRGSTRKLKDVFVEHRIPRSRRHRLPLLAAGEGEIVWIPGVAVADGLRRGLAAGNRWWLALGAAPGS